MKVYAIKHVSSWLSTSIMYYFFVPRQVEQAALQKKMVQNDNPMTIHTQPPNNGTNNPYPSILAVWLVKNLSPHISLCFHINDGSKNMIDIHFSYVKDPTTSNYHDFQWILSEYFWKNDMYRIMNDLIWFKSILFYS